MTDLALNPQDALVAVMVAVSVSDETIRTAELVKIEQIVNNLPVFGDYDADRTRSVAQTVFELFEEEDGLDALFGLVHEALPQRLVGNGLRDRLRRGGGRRVDPADGTEVSRGTAPFAEHRPAPRRGDRTGRAGAAHDALGEHRPPAPDKQLLQPLGTACCRTPARRTFHLVTRQTVPAVQIGAEHGENARLRPDGICT
jgi:hypothetical protein